MQTERIAILGTGTMGHSIALGCATNGFPVKIWGHSQADIDKGKTDLEEKIQLLVKEAIIDSDEVEKIRSSIVFLSSIEETVDQASFVIEAVPEILTLKQDLYQKLDALCAQDVILASNTSGLKASEISEKMNYPERMLITHFWNPAHLIPLVEVVRHPKTSDSAVARSMAFLKAIGKEPIEVKKEILGAIGNRLQFALLREAQHIVATGAATYEDVDKAVKYSIGRRLSVTGPFLSADMTGLDVCQGIISYLNEDLSKDNDGPLINDLIEKGKLGQKNGSGFYEWTDEMSQEINQERERELLRWLKK